MATSTIDAFGGIDYLVNNAAIYHGMRIEPIISVDLEYYNRIMAVNMNGVLHCSRACFPSMAERGGGAIVNQSSTAAWMAGGYYSIAKAGVNILTACLASELGSMNIRVNAIAPGPDRHRGDADRRSEGDHRADGGAARTQADGPARRHGRRVPVPAVGRSGLAHRTGHPRRRRAGRQDLSTAQRTRFRSRQRCEERGELARTSDAGYVTVEPRRLGRRVRRAHSGDSGQCLRVMRSFRIGDAHLLARLRVQLGGAPRAVEVPEVLFGRPQAVARVPERRQTGEVEVRRAVGIGVVAAVLHVEADDVVVDRVPVEHGVDLGHAAHRRRDPDLHLFLAPQRSPPVVVVVDVVGIEVDPGSPVLPHAAGRVPVRERLLDLFTGKSVMGRSVTRLANVRSCSWSLTARRGTRLANVRSVRAVRSTGDGVAVVDVELDRARLRDRPGADPGSLGGHLWRPTSRCCRGTCRPRSATSSPACSTTAPWSRCNPTPPAGRASVCLSGRDHLCPETNNRVHGVFTDGGLADEVIVDRSCLVALAAGVGPDVGGARRTDRGRAARGPPGRAPRRRPARSRPRDRRRQHRARARHDRASSRRRRRPRRAPPGAARGRRETRRTARRSPTSTTSSSSAPGASRRSTTRSAGCDRAARSSSRRAGSIRWRSARHC